MSKDLFDGPVLAVSSAGDSLIWQGRKLLFPILYDKDDFGCYFRKFIHGNSIVYICLKCSITAGYLRVVTGKLLQLKLLWILMMKV